MKNERAKTANEASREATGSSDGKNWLPMIAAKKPYTEKSYHSMKLPMVPAVTAFLAAPGPTCAAKMLTSRVPCLSLLLFANFRANALAGLEEKGRARIMSPSPQDV